MKYLPNVFLFDIWQSAVSPLFSKFHSYAPNKGSNEYITYVIHLKNISISCLGPGVFITKNLTSFLTN